MKSLPQRFVPATLFVKSFDSPEARNTGKFGEPMDQLKVSWLAGITDGEGSIYARWHSRSGGSLEHVWTVGMTCLHTMKTVQTLVREITGRKYKLHNSHAHRNNKACWRICVSRKSALLQLMEALLPYLVTKRAHALIMQRMAAYKVGHTTWGKPAERPEWVRESVIELKRLNHRGIPREAAPAEPVQT